MYAVLVCLLLIVGVLLMFTFKNKFWGLPFIISLIGGCVGLILVMYGTGYWAGLPTDVQGIRLVAYSVVGTPITYVIGWFMDKIFQNLGVDI